MVVQVLARVIDTCNLIRLEGLFFGLFSHKTNVRKPRSIDQSSPRAAWVEQAFLIANGIKEIASMGLKCLI